MVLFDEAGESGRPTYRSYDRRLFRHHWSLRGLQAEVDVGNCNLMIDITRWGADPNSLQRG